MADRVLHDLILFNEVASDLLRKAAALELVLRPQSALHLAGVLQLAGRHPDLSPASRAVITRYLTAVREYFADCPAVLELLAKGDDPAFDVVRVQTSAPLISWGDKREKAD